MGLYLILNALHLEVKRPARYQLSYDCSQRHGYFEIVKVVVLLVCKRATKWAPTAPEFMLVWECHSRQASHVTPA